MRLWKKSTSILCLCVFLLVSCALSQDAPVFAVRAAAIDHGALTAQLNWQPSAVLLDALDHGIALTFEITLRAEESARFGWHSTLARIRWHRELRYFPLTRQYQLGDPDLAPTSSAETRSYAARASLIAAIADLHLDLPPSWPHTELPGAVVDRYSLRIDLERDNLPGALRLPALIDADWRLSSGNYLWKP